MSPAAAPEAAVRRAAALTGTWSASTYAGRHARFAREAVGEARTGAELAAARAGTGDLAERSSTRVAAVEETRRRSGSAELVLLLGERAYTRDGRRSTRWRVVEATVTRRRAGWVVSRWAAQP